MAVQQQQKHARYAPAAQKARARSSKAWAGGKQGTGLRAATHGSQMNAGHGPEEGAKGLRPEENAKGTWAREIPETAGNGIDRGEACMYPKERSGRGCVSQGAVYPKERPGRDSLCLQCYAVWKAMI